MILVTGGAGYIGSHYVLYEVDRGSEVVVLDNLSQGHREAVGGVQLVVGDIASPDTLDTVFQSFTIEAVVHFAALASVPESMAHPERYYRNNVVAVVELLEAMRRHGVKFLVFSSSCATYGDPVYVPMDERHPQLPVSPYGETKRVCEKMMEAYDRAHGIRFASLRYFNASGADPVGRLGESHDPETHLIPIILQAASGRRKDVTIYGRDYDTPDGTCIRDYIHVTDLAQAHALALDRLRSGAQSDCFNLGSETGHSVLEVVEMCRRVTGRPIPTVDGPRRPGDPPRLVASAKRAKSELSWSPRYADLETIVMTAWAWETNRRF